MITLYGGPTPNARKIAIALLEMELDWRLEYIDILAGDQLTPEFLALNPNNKTPVIVDDDGPDGERFILWETGAILLYLAEKTGRLMPQDAKGRSRVLQWLMFQMGGIGPMMGQANVFFRYFPEKIPAAIDRYQGECKRLFRVLDGHLADHEYLAGDYSIADIANWAWVRTHRWSGVELDDLPHLKRWRDAIRARPAVQRGYAQPASKVDLSRYGDAAAQRFSVEARRLMETGQSLKADKGTA